MKRAAKSSNNKKKNGDFKRLKSKVGKKAPQRLNDTQTTFQSSAIHVQTQVNTFSKKSAQSNADDADQLTSLKLNSGKGNSVEYLLHQVGHHHSPIARLSALRGVLDAIQRLQKTNNANAALAVLVSHLSILIPGISKCLVDEDDSVRSTCLATFCALYQGLEGKNHDCVGYLLPFLPLHVAYLSSALNSLNGSIRLDAARCILILTSAFPHALGSYSSSSQKSNKNRMEGMLGMNLIPAFSRLLGVRFHGSAQCSGGITTNFGGVLQKEKQEQHRQKQARSRKHNKKNALRLQKAKDRKQTDFAPCSDTPSNKVHDVKYDLFLQNENEETTVLRSFLSLLRSIVLSLRRKDYDDGNSSVSPSRRIEGDALVYKVGCGGHAANGYLLFRCDGEAKCTSTTTVHGINDILFPLSEKKNSNIQHSLFSSTEDPPLSLPLCTAILSELRNSWIEISQKGTTHGSSYYALSSHYIPEISLIVDALAIFWKEFVAPFYSSRMDIVRNWQSLLMEALPVRDESGNVNNEGIYQELNSKLCCLLIDFHMNVNIESNIKKQNDMVHNSKEKIKIDVKDEEWLSRVIGYIVPRLNNCITAITAQKKEIVENDIDADVAALKTDSIEKKRASSIDSAPYSRIPIIVVSQLQLLQSKHDFNGKNSKWYSTLLYKFVQIFYLVQKITTARALLMSAPSESMMISRSLDHDFDCFVPAIRIHNDAMVLGCRLLMDRIKEFKLSVYKSSSEVEGGFWCVRDNSQGANSQQKQIKNRTSRMEKNVQTIAICLPIVILHSMQAWIRINRFIVELRHSSDSPGKRNRNLGEIELVSAKTKDTICEMMSLIMNLVRMQSLLPDSLSEEGKIETESDCSTEEKLTTPKQSPLKLFWNNCQIMMEALAMAPSINELDKCANLEWLF